MEKNTQPTLAQLQEKAFDRIDADAKAYAASDTATAIYLQETLFDMNVSHEADRDDLQRRGQIMREDDVIVLLTGELDEMRYRAALHGAGLATEPDESIPRAIRYRLSDNLSNYMPPMEYERTFMPWGYKLKRGELGRILAHDYFIAACDSADGDLNRLEGYDGSDLYD